MLVFALPELSGTILRNDNETAINWIIFNVSKLKNQAVNQGKNFSMCINTNTNTISIRETKENKNENENEDEDDQQNHIDTAFLDEKIISEFVMPENLTLDGVEFNRHGQKTTAERDACIQFNKQGYSDQAVIHISNNNGTNFSCFIRPFLNKVKIYQGYTGFE